MIRLDISTPIGILTASALILFAMSFHSNISSFFDFSSFLIVAVGTLVITIACFTLTDIISTIIVSLKAMFFTPTDTNLMVKNILEISDIIRKQGFLSLQQNIDKFSQYKVLAKGLRMYIDNASNEEVLNVVNQYFYSIIENGEKSIAIIKKAADIAPSMGLIGTLIGLVQMLSNIENPTTIGPAMAIALLTTLYGTFISFIVLNPIASKIEYVNQEYSLIGKISIKTLESIGKKENPLQLEVLLNSILRESEK